MQMRFGRYDYAAFAAFAAYACSSLVIPIVLVVMARELNFPLEDGGMSSGGQLHLARSVAMVVALLGSAAIAAKLGKRWTMGMAMLLMGVGIFFCGFAPTYLFLIPFVMLAGIGEGICEAMATPFIYDLHASGKAENYVTISHSFWSVGTGLVVIVAGWLLTQGVSWRLIVAGVGVACIGSAFGFIWRENPSRKYPEAAQESSDGGLWSKSWQICKSFRFWIYCFGMFVGAGAEFCLTFWAASFIQLNFETSPWVGGLGTAFIALGMFTGRFSYGRFVPAERLKHLLLAAGLVGIPVTLLILPLSPTSFGSPKLALAALFALMFVSGLCVAPNWPSLQTYGVRMLPELDSTLLFVYFSSIGIPGCGFFTWLMGVMGDRFGLRNSFLIIPISLLVFALTVFLEGFVFPKRNKH